MSWDLQQTYLDGLSAEEEIPFRMDAGTEYRPGQEAAPGMSGPRIREDVDAGVKVIDLAAMKAELEANPEARRRK